MKERMDKISEMGDSTKNFQETTMISRKENEKTIDSQEFMKLVWEPNLLDTKTKELLALGSAITAGCKHCIAIHVEKALDAGASREEILEEVSALIKNGPALTSIIELLRALSYEENKRAEYIDIVEDVRED